MTPLTQDCMAAGKEPRAKRRECLSWEGGTMVASKCGPLVPCSSFGFMGQDSGHVVSPSLTFLPQGTCPPALLAGVRFQAPKATGGTRRGLENPPTQELGN